MDFDKSYYRGKTAVVTGAASGIGLGLVEELLACGAEKVVLADYNAVNLKTHAERLEADYPGKVKGILCDVTEEQQVVDMIAGAAEFFGRKTGGEVEQVDKGGRERGGAVECAGAGLFELADAERREGVAAAEDFHGHGVGSEG